MLESQMSQFVFISWLMSTRGHEYCLNIVWTSYSMHAVYVYACIGLF